MLKDINLNSYWLYIFVFAVLLLMLPLPFRQLQNSEFPLYILAYPRLYGVIIMLYIGWRFIRGEIPNKSRTISMV